MRYHNTNVLFDGECVSHIPSEFTVARPRPAIESAGTLGPSILGRMKVMLPQAYDERAVRGLSRDGPLRVRQLRAMLGESFYKSEFRH